MGDRNLGREFVGGLGFLLGFAIVTWVVAGRPGLGGGDDVYKDVLSLLLAAILVVSGAMTFFTRREDFQKRAGQVTCAGCGFPRQSEPGDVCPQCGSPRLVLPWLSRLAVGSLALLFGVPPVGVLGALFVKGPQGLDVIFDPRVAVVVALSLFASVSSAFVLWQGRPPRIPWFPPSRSLSGELETILYSKAYAFVTIVVCVVVLAHRNGLFCDVTPGLTSMSSKEPPMSRSPTRPFSFLPRGRWGALSQLGTVEFPVAIPGCQVSHVFVAFLLAGDRLHNAFAEERHETPATPYDDSVSCCEPLRFGKSPVSW